MRSHLAKLATVAAIAEMLTGRAVRSAAENFQWLVAPADAAPDIDPGAIDRHAARSFDAELGWCRRPGETGLEETANGISRYRIDDRGRRAGTAYETRDVACFGDSFVFGRLVEDDQTWPEQLARQLGTGVDNYGVGNYGFDQALLRMERELPELPARVVIIGIVPETIARVQSFWKHYFEYGNTLAFKPRFTVTAGRLRFHPSVIQRPQEYAGYRRHLDHIRAVDRFWKLKFRGDVLAAPYLPRLARRARRHLPILWHLALGRLTGRTEAGRRRALMAVLGDNGRWVQRLYRDAESVQLMRLLIRRFEESCRAGGREPILLVIPQPTDLERRGRSPAPHERFFATLDTDMTVVDLTEHMRAHPRRGDCFTHGRLGSHPSEYGNGLIAEALLPHVKSALAQAPAQGARAHRVA